MTRLLGTFGMGSAFLLISPALRATAMNGFAWLVFRVQEGSPYSYVLLGLLFFGGAVASFNHTPRPQ
jgi:hypothetical protein